MMFLLNGLQFGGDSKIHIQSPITGLETPPIRLGAGDWAGRDGGYVSSQFFSSRVIVISGLYKGDTCDEAAEIRASMTRAFEIRKSLPLFITSFNGDRYYTDVYLQDVKMDIISDRSGIYQVTLVAPDALLYDAGDGVDPTSGWIEQRIYKLIGGGYITEYEIPVQWTPGTQPAAIVNEGDALVYPQIVMKGKLTNPRVYNLTENKFIQINISTSANDEIIIDMKQRVILLNGSSILSLRSLDSSWWGLSPGTSIISYESGNDTDVDYVTLRRRNGYSSI